MQATIKSIKIFESPVGWCIALAFNEGKANANLEIFNMLKERALNPDAMKWLDIHPTLSVHHNLSNDTIEFLEKRGHGGALRNDLPRALSVDWKIINDAECRMLSHRLELDKSYSKTDNESNGHSPY